MEKLHVVHWNINAACNMGCDFCYCLVEDSIRNLTSGDRKLIIKKLSDAGVKLLVFGGGDPLQLSEIMDLIIFSKKHGMRVALDTNAVEMKNGLLEEMAFYLDRLGLPLDGSNSEIHLMMRPRPNHFNRVLDILRKANKLEIPIKINTVATKINIDDIPNMVKILSTFEIEKWSVFEFSPLGRAKFFKDIYAIGRREFLDCRKDVLKQSIDFPVEFLTNDDRAFTYFLITPSGIVYTHPSSESNEYPILGDLLFDDVEEILNKGYFDASRHSNRYLHEGDIIER